MFAEFYIDKPSHIVKQMLEFLPENIKYALEHLNLQQLYEIRLRVGKPISVNYRGEYRFLGAYGVTEQAETALL